MRKNTFGFTLFEIVISFVILSILSLLGIMGFRDLVQNNKAVTMSNAFIGTLAFARSEAIKRGSTVSVCPAANPNFQACGDNTQWTNGWIVYVDLSNNGTIASPADRLRLQSALPAGSIFTTNINRITYNSAGFVTNGTGIFNLSAQDCLGNNGRQITINNTGRTDVVETNC
jgi:type IV fimbrial biogenesis protein FimT